MGDGRGFSIGARLRAMGYVGRLRAAGPLIADQFVAAGQGDGPDAAMIEVVKAEQCGTQELMDNGWLVVVGV